MLTKTFLATCCFLLLMMPCYGQQPAATQKPIIPATALRKTIGFMRVEFTKDNKQWNAFGTGFFVFLEDKRLGENKGFIYLVTNRHVAEPQEDGVKYPVGKTFIKLNFKQTQNGAESEEDLIPMTGPLHWYFSKDESVDLAVMPLGVKDTVDVEAFPVSLFATEDVIEKSQIAEGDSVLYTGYFSNFPNMKRVQPIVREGFIAMFPNELINTTLHKPGKIYLADIHVYEGNSGGPLFVNIAGFRNGSVIAGGFPYLLLGVVSGYYSEDAEFKLNVATTLEGKAKGNSGIATVVPADELKKILDSAELQKYRDANVAQQPH
jgi:hypothetical protein